MDNVTHALAGLLLADATVSWIERRTGAAADGALRRTVVTLGIVAAELPDADLLYSGPVVGMGKLGYLLHHRGHTHTVVFAIAAALGLWWLFVMLRKRRGEHRVDAERVPLLVLALAGTLSHLLLDFSNSYGVHPFWPLNNSWIYGDSVFIIEPWLWIAVIPPLLYGPRRLWSRMVLLTLLAVVLLASWRLGGVSPRLVLMLATGAAVWTLAQRWMRPSTRVTAGVVAWCIVEATFSASTVRARRVLFAQQLPDEQIVDIILTPTPANSQCIDGVVIAVSETEYRVRSATITPWTLQTSGAVGVAVSCNTRFGSSRLSELPGVRVLPATSVNGVTVHEQWTAPRSALKELAAAHCEVAAALRFLRAPVWRKAPDGTLYLSDVRFGVGTNGFSDVRVGQGPCTLAPDAWIPSWTPPRADVLSHSEAR